MIYVAGSTPSFFAKKDVWWQAEDFATRVEQAVMSGVAVYDALAKEQLTLEKLFQDREVAESLINCWVLGGLLIRLYQRYQVVHALDGEAALTNH